MTISTSLSIVIHFSTYHSMPHYLRYFAVKYAVLKMVSPVTQSTDFTKACFTLIDHILIDRRWHLSVLDVRSFRGADCDTEHYLVVAKVRERLAVSKQVAQTFDGERFNLRKLNELEVRKQCQIEITNRFAALENLSNDEDINRGWENINPLNTELNPICHLLALLEIHHILHVSRIRVSSEITKPFS